MEKRISKFILLLLAALLIGFFPLKAFAEDPMSKARTFFMQRQYWQTVEACTDVINNYPHDPGYLSEANYLAGASYVNLFDFLTAKKSFKAVVEKYKWSAYYEDAYLGLGDVELLQENFQE